MNIRLDLFLVILSLASGTYTTQAWHTGTVADYTHACRKHWFLYMSLVVQYYSVS